MLDHDKSPKRISYPGLNHDTKSLPLLQETSHSLLPTPHRYPETPFISIISTLSNRVNPAVIQHPSQFVSYMALPVTIRPPFRLWRVRPEPYGTGPGRAGPGRVGSCRVGSGRVGSGRYGSDRVGSGGSGRARLGLFGPNRVGSGRAGSGRDKSGRVGSGRVGSGRDGSGRVGSHQIGPVRVRASRVGPGHTNQPLNTHCAVRARLLSC